MKMVLLTKIPSSTRMPNIRASKTWKLSSLPVQERQMNLKPLLKLMVDMDIIQKQVPEQRQSTTMVKRL